MFHGFLSEIVARFGSHRPRRVRSLIAASILFALMSSFLVPGASRAQQSSTPAREASVLGPDGEMLDMRTANSKTYGVDGGSNRAEVYPGPVHFETPQGDWENIDNTLVPSDRPGYAYENAANSYKVLIPAELEQTPVRIEVGDEWVTYQLEEATGAPEVDGDSVTFADAVQGVDLSYRVLNTGVEEDLTLPSPNAPSTYSFDVETSPGVVTTESPNGSIAFSEPSSGEEFSFGTPVMYEEGQSEVSKTAAMDVIGSGSEFTVQLEGAEQWLEADGRDYPVVIDPLWQSQAGVGRNCWLGSASSEVNSNFCFASELRAGYDAPSSAKRRTIIRFPDLETAIPQGSVVQDATMRLCVTSRSTTGAIPIKAHRVEEYWTSQAGWKVRTLDSNNNAIQWATWGGTYNDDVTDSNTSVGGAVGKYEYWYPVSAVQRWLDGDKPNHGLLLKGNESANQVVRFAGMDYPTSGGPGVTTDCTDGKKPKLTIEYIEPRCNPGLLEADDVGVPDDCGFEDASTGAPADAGDVSPATPDPDEGDDYITSSTVSSDPLQVTPAGQMLVVDVNAHHALGSDYAPLCTTPNDELTDEEKDLVSFCSPQARKRRLAKRIVALGKKPLALRDSDPDSLDGMGFAPDVILFEEIRCIDLWKHDGKNGILNYLNRYMDFVLPGEPVSAAKHADYDVAQADGQIACKGGDKTKVETIKLDDKGHYADIYSDTAIVYLTNSVNTLKVTRMATTYAVSERCEGTAKDATTAIAEDDRMYDLYPGPGEILPAGYKHCTRDDHLIYKRHFAGKFEKKVADENGDHFSVGTVSLHLQHDPLLAKDVRARVKEAWLEKADYKIRQKYFPNSEAWVIGGDLNSGRCSNTDSETRDFEIEPLYDTTEDVPEDERPDPPPDEQSDTSPSPDPTISPEPTPTPDPTASPEPTPTPEPVSRARTQFCGARQWWKTLTGVAEDGKVHNYDDAVYTANGPSLLSFEEDQTELDEQFKVGCVTKESGVCTTDALRKHRIDNLFLRNATTVAASSDLTCGESFDPVTSSDPKPTCKDRLNPSYYSDHTLIWALIGRSSG